MYCQVRMSPDMNTSLRWSTSTGRKTVSCGRLSTRLRLIFATCTFSRPVAVSCWAVAMALSHLYTSEAPAAKTPGTCYDLGLPGPPRAETLCLHPNSPGRTNGIQESGTMARVCEVCGKKPVFGHNVSHAHNVTNRSWHPNIQRVRVAMPGGGTKRKRVCTRCIRDGKVQKKVS